MGSYFRDYYSPTATQRPTVGDTKMSVVGQDHMGWLNCDGRILSTTTYNLLFQVIGYKFGGSGSNFNLPDARGRVAGANGTGPGPTTWVLGDVSGEQVHTLTIAEMPAHKHGSADVTGNTNGNGNTGNTTLTVAPASVTTSISTSSTLATPVGGGAINSVTANNTNTSISPNPHNHTIGSTGGGQTHQNMQPTIFLGNTFIFSGKPLVGGYPYNGTNAVIL